VVLAVCAGGLRRYLDLQGELPDESLVAAAPIAVRGGGDAAGEAQFAWVRVELGTDIADPVARLAAIRDLMASSDVMNQAVSARELADVVQFAPSAAIAATSKLLRSASALLGNWTPLANCAIANVPGPQVPLYLQGARLSYLSAIMPIADGMGLVFSVSSYNDMLIVSFTGCYEQLPDPEQLAQALRDSFQEYLALLKPPARRKPKLAVVAGSRNARRTTGAARPSRRAASRPCAQRSERMAANPLHLEYESLGDPAHPAIVLIMGLGMQMIAWPDSFCQALVARGFRVIRFDNRDVGLSPRTPGRKHPKLLLAMAAAALGLKVRTPYTLDDMAADTIGLMDRLGKSSVPTSSAPRWAA
jgi:hypothetical protein